MILGRPPLIVVVPPLITAVSTMALEMVELMMRPK